MSLDSIVRLIRCSSLCSSEQWQGAQLYAISAWEIISDNTRSYTVMCRIACFLLSLEREEERSSEGLQGYKCCGGRDREGTNIVSP